MAPTTRILAAGGPQGPSTRQKGRQTDRQTAPTPCLVALMMTQAEVRAEKPEVDKHPPADLCCRRLLQAGDFSVQTGLPHPIRWAARASHGR